jgi:hypothetical protein
MTLRIILLLCALSIVPESIAKPLIVSIPSSIDKNYSNIVERVKAAFDKANIEYRITRNSNKRSLILLKRNEVDIEIYRTPSVMGDHQHLLKLEPALLKLNFSMFTSSANAKHCELKSSDYGHLSMAGLSGVELHEMYFSPKFAHYTSLHDAEAYLRFIALGRADVGFLPAALLEEKQSDTGSEEIIHQLTVCRNQTIAFTFHAYMHKNAAGKQDKIEAALIEEFR